MKGLLERELSVGIVCVSVEKSVISIDFELNLEFFKHQAQSNQIMFSKSYSKLA